jgi:hypothetical protein
MFARCLKSSGKRYIITETNIHDLSMFFVLDFFLLGLEFSCPGPDLDLFLPDPDMFPAP